MAWVEQHGNLFHVAFRIGERRFKKTLKSTDRRAADALAQRIDERLRLIDQGHITLPEGVDLVAYLFSDGRLDQVATPEKEVSRTLGFLMDEYLMAVSNGSMESNTLLTLRIHQTHIQPVLGKNFRGESLTFAVLQTYVNMRAKCRGRRGKPLSVNQRNLWLIPSESLGFPNDLHGVNAPVRLAGECHLCRRNRLSVQWRLPGHAVREVRISGVVSLLR